MSVRFASALIACLLWFVPGIIPLLQGQGSVQARGMQRLHFPASNESRLDLFRPYIAGRGGDYFGVGTDQNFMLIAWARSRRAFLVDIDPQAAAVNRLHLLFLRLAEDRHAFRRLWDRDRRAASFRHVRREFYGSEHWPSVRKAWNLAHRGRRDVPARLESLDRMRRETGALSFLHDDAQYEWLRRLARCKCISVRVGDVGGSRALPNIYRTVTDLNVRVFYISNVEEGDGFPDGYRRNIMLMPGDPRSVLLRTSIRAAQSATDVRSGGVSPVFHYNVQSLSSFQKILREGNRPNLPALLRRARMVRPGLSVYDVLNRGAEPSSSTLPGRDPV